MKKHDTNTFPPTLAVDNRVWTKDGYKGHGPPEGPRVDITGNQGGTVVKTDKPYSTMDHLLYTVRWDKGQVSKHYEKDLFCIGPYQSRAEFEGAIKPTGDVELTVGPARGFRSARFELEYGGKIQIASVQNRKLWSECIDL